MDDYRVEPYEEPVEVEVITPEVVSSPFLLPAAQPAPGDPTDPLTPNPERLAVEAAVDATAKGTELVAALEAVGINSEYLATKVIKKGLKAKKETFDRQGELIRVSPDHATRHKFLNTVLEIRGDLKPKSQGQGESFEEVLMMIRARRVTTSPPIAEPAA